MDFVHHIKGDHHGYIHLKELQCEIHVSLYIHRIDDIDYRLRFLS